MEYYKKKGDSLKQESNRLFKSAKKGLEDNIKNRYLF